MNLSSVVCVALFALVGCLSSPASAADFIDLRHIDPLSGDPSAGKAMADNLCKSCHGENGASMVPIFPDLGGQKVDYLYHQLLRFKSGVLVDSPMTALIAPYGDAELRNFALYYAAMPAPDKSVPIADQKLFDRGHELYTTGDSGSGIPPCQGCHGIDARGVQDERYLAYPMLRHQNADYIANRLKDYRSGKLAATSNDFIMQSVAHRLDDEAIAAIAAWLASAP